jgi:hypothetical protein
MVLEIITIEMVIEYIEIHSSKLGHYWKISMGKQLNLYEPKKNTDEAFMNKKGFISLRQSFRAARESRKNLILIENKKECMKNSKYLILFCLVILSAFKTMQVQSKTVKYKPRIIVLVDKKDNTAISFVRNIDGYFTFIRHNEKTN